MLLLVPSLILSVKYKSPPSAMLASLYGMASLESGWRWNATRSDGGTAAGLYGIQVGFSKDALNLRRMWEQAPMIPSIILQTVDLVAGHVKHGHDIDGVAPTTAMLVEHNQGFFHKHPMNQAGLEYVKMVRQREPFVGGLVEMVLITGLLFVLTRAK